MIMSYEEFKEKVKEEAEKELGQGIRVEFQTTQKMNSVSREEMRVYADDMSILPVIPLKQIYASYVSGQIDVPGVIQLIRLQLDDCPEYITKVVEGIINRQVNDQIFMRIINYDKNEERLKHMPHKRVFDLAIVYYIGSGCEGENSYTISVDNNLMKYLGLTSEELEKTSYHNSMRVQEPMLKSIKEMLMENLWDLAIEEADIEEKDVRLYVLTNKEKCLGAACMFYEGVLKDFAEQIQDDFYILPSSIHEVMLIPKAGNEDWEGLRQMVREINDSVIDEAEVLSGEVYYYNRIQNEVIMCR